MPLAKLRKLQLKDYLTLGNAVSGMLAIVAAWMGQIAAPFFLILLGMAFDYFDGKVARKTNKADDFGKQLDSLADVVSFAVAPAVIVMQFTFLAPWAVLSGILYTCAGILRLAFFNVQKESGVYYGVPIPVAAFGAILGGYAALYGWIPAWLCWVWMAVLGALMLGSFKIKKP